MGFINNKAETINNVALFETLGNLPKGKNTSSLESVNSKDKNLSAFLLDVLTTTCKDNTKYPTSGLGTSKCEATRILTEILVQFYPVLMLKLKEGLIQGIKAGLACSSNFTLPTNGVIKIKIKAEKIDYNDILRLDPSSPIGSTFYGKNSTTDLNWALSDLTRNGGTITWKNMIDINFNQTTQDFEVGLNSNYLNITRNFDNFLSDFLNASDLMTLEQFLAKITDKLTGSLTSAKGRLDNGINQLQNPAFITSSLDKLISVEQTDKLIDKIMSSDPCTKEYQITDNFFSFTNEESFEIENRAEQKSKGEVNLDVGCGIIPVSVSPSTIIASFNSIKNAPSSKLNEVVFSSVNSINNNLTNNVSESDKNTAKRSLNAEMIKSIPKVLTDMIVDPKIIILYQIANKIVNGPLTPSPPPVGVPGGSASVTSPNVNANTSFDYAKASKVFFEYVVRESSAALLEILFNLAKREILNLVLGVAANITKTQSNLKIKRLLNVVRVVDVPGIAEGVLNAIPPPNTSQNL